MNIKSGMVAEISSRVFSDAFSLWPLMIGAPEAPGKCVLPPLCFGFFG